MTVTKLVPPPLPTTREGWLARRTKKRNIIDNVEDLFLEKSEDPEFTKYFDAVVKEQTIEGSFKADYQEAARMLRQLAVDKKDGVVAKANLVTISKCIVFVLNRLKESPRLRRERAVAEEVDVDVSDLIK